MNKPKDPQQDIKMRYDSLEHIRANSYLDQGYKYFNGEDNFNSSKGQIATPNLNLSTN